MTANSIGRLRPLIGAAVLLLVAAGCQQQEATPEAGTDTAAAAPATSAQARGPSSPFEAKRERAGEPGQQNTLCSLGSVGNTAFVDGVVTTTRAKNVLFRGWLGDPATMSRPARGVIRLELRDGSRAWEFPLGPARDRPDVVAAYGNDSMADTGFLVRADLQPLPPGNYTVLLSYYAGNQRFDCSDRGKRRLVLSGN